MAKYYPTKSVKYLGIKIDENLTWIDHINDTAIKLNRIMLCYLNLGGL